MNRDEVLEQLAPLAGTQVRTGNGGGRVLVDSGGGGFALRPSHRARSLELAPQGVAGLLNYTGVSDTLAKRLTPATLAQVATESLHARSGNGEYTVLTQEGQVVDFAQPGRFREIRPDRVVGNIERGIPDEVEFNRVLTLPHHTVRIETMGTQERAVRVGDLVRAGTMTQFSPLGLTEAVVQAYNVRLVCTNGMTTTDVVREFRMTGGRGGPGEGDDIWQFFRRSNRDAYRAFGQVVDRYTAMAQQNVPPEDRGSVLEALMREGGIRGDIANAIRNNAIAEPPETEWDMVNLISQATSHIIEDARQVVRAQRAAASFTAEAEHRRICPTCSRAR